MSTLPDLGFTITIKTLDGTKPYHYVLVQHPKKELINNHSMHGVATFCNSYYLEAVEQEAKRLAKLLGVPLENIQRETVA